MSWRKWLVRSLVFSVLGVAVLIALLFEAWTNPAAVRRQVIAKLDKLFIGANLNLDSARLRLLGGIAVRDLRMARRDDLDRGDLLYVPSAVIYHDKEHLLDGTLGVRKIELDRPRLRIVRQRDGRLNLAGLLAPPDLKERVPTLIIRRGIIVLEDRRDAGSTVLLEIKDVNLSIVNDPLSTLVIEGNGQTDAAGAVRIHARFHRPTDAASALLELPHVPVGAALTQRLAGLCPDFARHLRALNGTAKIQTTLAYRPDAVEPWSYDVNCELTNGEWHHECLPAPLSHIRRFPTLHQWANPSCPVARPFRRGNRRRGSPEPGLAGTSAQMHRGHRRQIRGEDRAFYFDGEVLRELAGEGCEDTQDVQSGWSRQLDLHVPTPGRRALGETLDDPARRHDSGVRGFSLSPRRRNRQHQRGSVQRSRGLHPRRSGGPRLGSSRGGARLHPGR